MIKALFGGGKTANVEIERKFLIRARPDRKPDARHKIRQGYIAREAGNVVRVRQMDDHYYLTVKTPARGIGRYEIEKEIAARDARTLFDCAVGPLIEKTREIYRIGDHVWEMDIFEGANKGLIVAEVELSAENEEIAAPDWIGPEVTGLQKFYNAQLARNPFKTWGVSYADLVARLEG